MTADHHRDSKYDRRSSGLALLRSSPQGIPTLAKSSKVSARIVIEDGCGTRQECPEWVCAVLDLVTAPFLQAGPVLPGG
jgi:hypothetical protein